ncbi:MAG: phospholipase A [Ghiorsea sp.]
MKHHHLESPNPSVFNKYVFTFFVLSVFNTLCFSQAEAVSIFGNNKATRCADIQLEIERLACYDRLFNSTSEQPLLEHIWELYEDDEQLFAFSGFRPTYLFPIHYVNPINNTPSSPSHTPSTLSSKLDNVETAFQISFKNKLMNDVPWVGGKVWFTYTQRSYWQLYNTTQSSLFRETDYEPQLVLSMPVKKEWQFSELLFSGLTWKMLNIGITHQSNGRGGHFSRSWNRLFAEFGIENEHLSIMIRPWYRIPEKGTLDDNPDITKYMGRGDIRLIYHFDRQLLSFKARFNALSHKGAVQLDYVFPLKGELQGYLQLFRGYGESIIDYNHFQNSAGLGILIKSW